MALSLPLGAAAFELCAQWQTGLRPHQHSYGAVVHTVIAIQARCVATTAIMGLYTVARQLCGVLDSVRRTTFDNTMLFWHYLVGQG